MNEFAEGKKITGQRPARPFVRYPGAKNLLAPWIISHFPARHDTFILPYGGSAATLFAKNRSGIEVYNDINGELVHLFRTIREDTAALVMAITYTLWSPAELALALEPTDDPIERARRFYVRLWMSRYPFDKAPAFRRQKIFSRGRAGSTMRAAAVAFTDIEHLFPIADRLRGVAVESQDAIALIRQYDYERALFYCDPPYVHGQRSRKAHYDAEMDTTAHAQLATVLNAIDGMAIVSGYKNIFYVKWYEDNGWRRVDRESRVDGVSNRTESLWLSVKAAAYLDDEWRPGKQASLGITANYGGQK